MGITFTSQDFCPLEEFAFQHWCDRGGRRPFDQVRPLSADAAGRVWHRALELSRSAWADDDGARLDLHVSDDWTPADVREWLLARVDQRDADVIVCFQPRVAVVVPWGVLCDHWLTLLWTGGCAWPMDEGWVLVHDGDQFALGRRHA